MPAKKVAKKAPVAIITGVTGQDGSYLAELLLEKGYVVHGIKRRASSFNQQRIEHLFNDPALKDQFFIHYGDLMDVSDIIRLLNKVRPDEVYNLAAQSHVAVSFEMPIYTAGVDGVGVINLMEGIRACGLTKTTKFYQASTSELFGLVQEIPQKETTPFYPRSPYAVAKLMAYWAVVNQREAYGMFACNGILFNHESPRRGETFVTRKITMAVASIKLGRQETLSLGNIDSLRDWGHARDYVECMWKMLQQDEAEDFVISQGTNHSVRTFVTLAFQHAGVEIVWTGKGVDEIGTDKATGVVRVKIDPKYFRPTEVEQLLGDHSKAKAKLGWTPTTSLEDLVKEMVTADLACIEATLEFDKSKARYADNKAVRGMVANTYL